MPAVGTVANMLVLVDEVAPELTEHEPGSDVDAAEADAGSCKKR